MEVIQKLERYFRTMRGLACTVAHPTGQPGRGTFPLCTDGAAICRVRSAPAQGPSGRAKFAAQYFLLQDARKSFAAAHHAGQRPVKIEALLTGTQVFEGFPETDHVSIQRRFHSPSQDEQTSEAFLFLGRSEE